MRLSLPDCKDRADPFALSPEDRRELVRRIAEKGAAAIDEFIREREAQGDSAIAARVRRLRDELLRRAEELKRRLAGEFAEREAALEAEYAARLATLQDEERALRQDLDRLRAGSQGALEAALRANPVLGVALSHDLAARPPWWRRALAAAARVLRALLAPLTWLLRLLTGRRREAPRGPDTVGLAMPVGAGGIPFADAGELYLSNREFRQAVKARLRAQPARERLRRAWERLLGLEDYESLARKAMGQMMREAAERAQSEQAQRETSLQTRLSDLLAREEQARAGRAQSEAELAREREAQARAIEQALRDAPEREVKEAIVDELKAAGLLRETGAGLLPTLQFMDRFAALVYDDERGRGAGPGAGGEYAEGEGHYRREPLRSAIEISRMDVLASLLRARSRHPKVRHMTDDDVVVYREERESLLQVVLVVDRSGSMEDNGRMEAAKRATLALHHAVKARNPRNRVDVMLMDTSVRSATLREVWETEPTGFTNHGAAMRLARGLCRRRGRTLVYFITDGLPEAYTKNGEDVAGHPEKAMAYAKEQARLLARERSIVGFVMLLLEPKDEMYVKAAQALADEAGGRVVPVDPQELAGTLLRELRAGEMVAV